MRRKECSKVEEIINEVGLLPEHLDKIPHEFLGRSASENRSCACNGNAAGAGGGG